MMLLGLILGYYGGQILAGKAQDTAAINTISLMLAGTLTGLLLAPRVERFTGDKTRLLRVWYESLRPSVVAAATFGLIVALLLSVLLGSLLRDVPFYSWLVSLLVTLVSAVFFIAFTVRNADAFEALAFQQIRRKPGSKILDTNVIIDGRVVYLVRSGFLEGELIVPAFVLKELQTLADSADGQKRTRGKRGLSLLEELREIKPLRIEDWDHPHIENVDDKLIRLARDTEAKLVTNDNNLSKIAKLHGIIVLSLHEAAVALKPQLQAGDPLTITISKGGQQQGQGIGYLEDGTMVVVEDAIRHRNKAIQVIVVNNVQTNVGRMVFARLDDGREPNRDGTAADASKILDNSKNESRNESKNESKGTKSDGDVANNTQDDEVHSGLRSDLKTGNIQDSVQVSAQSNVVEEAAEEILAPRSKSKSKRSRK